jgi:hypothetical protein
MTKLRIGLPLRNDVQTQWEPHSSGSEEPPSLFRRNFLRLAELRYTESYSSGVQFVVRLNSFPAVVPAAVGPRTRLFLYPTRGPERSL